MNDHDTLGVPTIKASEFKANRAVSLPNLHALDGHRLVTADPRMLDWPGPLDRITATQ